MQTVVWCADIVLAASKAVRNDPAVPDDVTPTSVRAVEPLSLNKLPMALNVVISMRNTHNKDYKFTCGQYH